MRLGTRDSTARRRSAVAIGVAFVVPLLFGIAALVLRSSGWIDVLERDEIRAAERLLDEAVSEFDSRVAAQVDGVFLVERLEDGRAGAPFETAPRFWTPEALAFPGARTEDPDEAASLDLLRELGRSYTEARVQELALDCFDRAFQAASTEEGLDLSAWTSDQCFAAATTFDRAARHDDAEALRVYLRIECRDEWRDLVSVPVLSALATLGASTEGSSSVHALLVGGELPIDPRTVEVLSGRFGLEESARQAFEAAGWAVRTERCPEFPIGRPSEVKDRAIVSVLDRQFRFLGATIVDRILEDVVATSEGSDSEIPLRVRRRSVEGEDGVVLAESELPAVVVVSTTTLASERLRSIGWTLGLAALVTLVLGQLLVWRLVRREVQLTRMKSDFVDLVSHELRTPLSALTIKTEMLAHGHVPDGKRERYGKDIHHATLRLGALVEEILDFARLEKGQTGPERHPIDVRDVVADGLRRARESLRASRMRVRIDVRKGMPELDVDRVLVARALRNLFDNAAKHARGASLQIRVDRDPDSSRPGFLRIEVFDDGPGFRDVDPETLFDPFARAAEPGSRVHGSGLGLAIVRQVADLHGGRVRASAVSDEAGARFELWLPIVSGASGGRRGVQS
ncbi:MAG: HAMP domain-containing sensor histidine kinase [Planctomycetota bacterium]